MTDYDDEDDGREGRCPRCDGDGWLEYSDAPETWGEDSPSEMNHLVTCPVCRGEGELE